MKLLIFAPKDDPNRSRIGILEDNHVLTLSPQSDDMVKLIEHGALPSPDGERFPLDDVILKAPLSPRKITCVGRNYVEHANELGNDVPDEPLLFAKLITTVIGPGEKIRWRESTTTQVDWEVELAVVIGKPARYVREEDAMQYVFGYTVANDVSARDLQSQDRLWIRAKGLDTFCPLGPWIVTRDEIVDPHALAVRTTVNGEVMQDSNTSLMMFRIPFLISYCSQAFTLMPGDLLLTGTPGGVGKGKNPPRFLQHGDTVTVSVGGIGEITNTCHVENVPLG